MRSSFYVCGSSIGMTIFGIYSCPLLRMHCQRAKGDFESTKIEQTIELQYALWTQVCV